jgi:hypothetical protein
MADTLEVDSGWVVETLTTICGQQATAAEALVNIDRHLAQQNKAIEKGQLRGANHEIRLSSLERGHENERKRWKTVIDVVLKFVRHCLITKRKRE